MQPLDEIPIDIVIDVLGDYGIFPFIEYSDGQKHWGTGQMHPPGNPYLGKFVPADFSSPGHYNMVTIRVIAVGCNKAGDLPEIEEVFERRLQERQR